MISRVVRRKLNDEQRRVEQLVRDLVKAVEAKESSLSTRANQLEQSLVAHWELVSYVIDSISDDDPEPLSGEDLDDRV